MTRKEFEKHVFDTYGIEADYPWQTNPNFGVFRHPVGKKWFALVMDISKRRLGKDDVIADVVNLKCAPSLISSFCRDDGIYPAYHMNKANWISVVLADADEDEIKTLTDISFNLTIKKLATNKIENENKGAL